ncbi:MAG: adenylate kinase [Chloroflexi bacterium]|nr:adenylate kinase [Chloroflexota bacterium]
MGAPGAGKGTQAAAICEHLDLPHISSGNIFRENINNRTDLGKTAKSFLDSGDLAPDNITIAMIRERLSREDCSRGAVLDGFPRTPTQALALDEILSEFQGKVDVVPFIEVEENLLIARLTGRWTCRAKGHIFHEINNPPQEPGICDFDGSELFQREDDEAETVAKRIRVYLEQTKPLIDFFDDKGLLKVIEGSQPIRQVTAELLSILPKVS